MSVCIAERAVLSPSLEELWRDIIPDLDKALELEGAARERWLAELHAERPERAAKIRGYLSELELLDARNFMGGPVPLLIDTDLTGQRLGAYTLDHVIGRGGMGT